MEEMGVSDRKKCCRLEDMGVICLRGKICNVAI